MLEENGRQFQINFFEWKLFYFDSKAAFDNKAALVQIMAWHQTVR